MAQLEKYQIRVCDIIANDEWSPAGEFRALQMDFNSFEESVSIALLMLRVVYRLIVGEECRNEERSPFQNISCRSYFNNKRFSQSMTMSQMASAQYF